MEAMITAIFLMALMCITFLFGVLAYGFIIGLIQRWTDDG